MNRDGRRSLSNEMASVSLDLEALGHLVAEAQRGDRPAADRLVREHQRWVCSVIYGVSGRPDLVEDVAQQVWTQVWQRLDSLKDPRRLRSWLYTIARNAAIDAGVARKRHRDASVGLDAVKDGLGDRRAPGPVSWAMGNETHRMLLGAIEALPAIYREPFALRHLEDWSYARIGEALGLPVETVETRLVRARRLLRESLKGKIEP